MPQVASPRFLQDAIAFERATANPEKNAAVLAMLKSGEVLYAQYGDAVSNGLAEQDKRAIYEGTKELRPTTQKAIAIVRKALMTKTVLALKQSAYNDGVDDLIKNHLQPDTPPDEFATAHLALNAITADLANEDLNAMYKTIDYAMALGDCPHQDHFANEDGSTNQSESINLLHFVTKTIRTKYDAGEADGDMLIAVMSKKYDLMLDQGKKDMFEKEWAQDEKNDPVMVNLHKMLKEMLTVQNYPGVINPNYVVPKRV